MHAFASRNVSVHEKIMNVQTIETKSEVDVANRPPRCIYRLSSMSTSPIPKFSCRAISILVLVLIVSCSWQSVAAFTTSRTIIGVVVSRHRINYKYLARTPDVTSPINGKSDGKDDSERNELRTMPTSSHRTTIPDARRAGILRAIQAANTLLSSAFNVIFSWNAKLRDGYNCRINADPSFFGKSITEVFVAAGTQLMAEWNRRGSSRIFLELDFVVPAVLTAVFGKYYRCVDIT